MHYQGGKKESSHYSTASYWAAPTSGGVVSGENELCMGCRSTTFFSLHIKHDGNGSQIRLHYKYIYIYIWGGEMGRDGRTDDERGGVPLRWAVCEPPSEANRFSYKSIPVEDNHKADISSWFNEAIDFIDSVKNDGGRVFVHCQAGISRSATICLAYLMRTNRVKLDEAFEFVKQRRSIISPNFSFMGQLLQFESQVLAPNCSAEAGSPAMSVLDRGASTTTVFNFPVSIPVHTSSSALSYLQSPITTSPSC
uniref:protein-tyrosine-phosphatase n=1 Tax=Buteo japonicus TaxID=224669 RepID=A0A8C0AMR9_9AVES